LSRRTTALIGTMSSTVMCFLWFCLICIWLPLNFYKWLLPSWLLQILQVKYYGGMTLYFYVFFLWNFSMN
jgi:hypothetical protein